MFKNRSNSGGILNIGHRGAPAVAPENTLSSFMKALEMGADGIELDVALSSDGAVMVFHDYFLHKKTDGRGLLTKRTKSELQALDARGAFSGEYPQARIPTLQEVVEALDAKAFIMIEIKTNLLGRPGIEKAVASVISAYNLYGRVVVSSFNPLVLKRIKQADSNIPVGLLHVPLLPALMKNFSFTAAVRPDVLHPLHKTVNENYMKHARAMGCRIIAWTLKTDEDIKRMIDIGVDGIITDYPDIVRKLKKQTERE